MQTPTEKQIDLFFQSVGGRKWWKHTRLAQWIVQQYAYSERDWGVFDALVRKYLMYDWTDAASAIFGEPPIHGE